MEIGAVIFGIVFLFFVGVFLWLRRRCQKKHRENDLATLAIQNLENSPEIEEVNEEELNEALRNKRVYMVIYPHPNVEGFGMISAPRIRFGDADLYNWEPYSYYGGLWIKQHYPPTVCKKQNVWRPGTWKTCDGIFCYITE